jgi:nardilysin
MSEVQVLTTPIKSEGDKKSYRLIKLPNGLKALLIHKPEDSADQEILAAADLTVSVGSFHEPKEIGGLAHFLEHMLFMGSEKYPKENGYSQFIAENGGNYNAMTENEYTTYYFDVSETAFPEALDRFAQQFVSPLLLKDALQREREAVDSEFQMASTRDGIRISAFYKTFINENNPASFFDYGNLKTLKDEIADDELYIAVREFFKKYIANKMSLSLQSTRTLDEIQELVVKNFSGLKSGEIVEKSLQKVDEIFLPKFYEKIYFVKPKKEMKALYLSWFIDPVDKHYKCNPIGYLKEVFKNQGDGGLSNYLREKKLGIGATMESEMQSFDANSMFALVKIVVKLTDEGLEQIEKVLEAIFSYLLMIKETSVDDHRRLYEELKEKKDISFRFHSENDASDNVFAAAAAMNYFDDEDILRQDSIYQKFDEKIILEIIEKINERKFNTIIVAENHEKFELKEIHFSVEYDEIDFPENYQRLWDERKANPEFYLEKTNPFKATNFEIFENPEESPVSLKVLKFVLFRSIKL